MQKKLCVVLGVLVVAAFVCSSAWATGISISWYNFGFGVSGAVGDEGGTPIARGNGLTGGGFLQLIWTGADGEIDPAVQVGTGVTDDDVVLAVWYFDGGALAEDGVWSSGNTYDDDTDNGVVGNTLYVRAWKDVSSGYTGSSNDPVPVVPTYYGDTTNFWTVGAGGSQDYDHTTTGPYAPNQNWNTDTYIPEPGTFSLLLLGFAAIGIRRKMRK